MADHTFNLVKDCLNGAGIEINGARIAALGLAFKGETGDLRESPALRVVDRLVKNGANVIAYDPYTIHNEIAAAKSWKDAVTNADACVVLTEHNEFKKIKLEEMRSLMKNNCLIDARHVFEPKEARKNFAYRGIGRG